MALWHWFGGSSWCAISGVVFTSYPWTKTDCISSLGGGSGRHCRDQQREVERTSIFSWEWEDDFVPSFFFRFYRTLSIVCCLRPCFRIPCVSVCPCARRFLVCPCARVPVDSPCACAPVCPCARVPVDSACACSCVYLCGFCLRKETLRWEYLGEIRNCSSGDF